MRHWLDRRDPLVDGKGVGREAGEDSSHGSLDNGNSSPDNENGAPRSEREVFRARSFLIGQLFRLAKRFSDWSTF